MFTVGQTVKDQYGKKSIIIDIFDNVVKTTAGTYHISKVFAVK